MVGHPPAANLVTWENLWRRIRCSLNHYRQQFEKFLSSEPSSQSVQACPTPHWLHAIVLMRVGEGREQTQTETLLVDLGAHRRPLARDDAIRSWTTSSFLLVPWAPPQKPASINL